MKRFKAIVVAVGGLVLVLGLLFFIIGLLKPKVAGIYIETSPVSTVYINGQEVGKTPYDETLEPGEVIVRLVPETFQTPLPPYETKVSLLAGVKTVITRDFGKDEDTSSGELISFERIGRGDTSMVIVTIPDSARLIIDGKERAYTPHKTSSVLPGVHRLTFSADGYQEKTVEVKTHEGYKLTAFVKLAKADEAGPTPPPGVAGSRDEAIPQVEILSTPTGFLRVRAEPSSLAEEVGRVQPGERYKLLEVDERTGWYKIEFEAGDGWISNQYAKKLGNEDKAVQTPTPSKILLPTPSISPALNI